MWAPRAGEDQRWDGVTAARAWFQRIRARSRHSPAVKSSPERGERHSAKPAHCTRTPGRPSRGRAAGAPGNVLETSRCIPAPALGPGDPLRKEGSDGLFRSCVERRGVAAPIGGCRGPAGARLHPVRHGGASGLAQGACSGTGRSILAFYPRAFTSGCTHELRSYAEHEPELASKGAQLCAISVDDRETLAASGPRWAPPSGFCPTPTGRCRAGTAASPGAPPTA